jgi:hypothetical protein
VRLVAILVEQGRERAMEDSFLDQTAWLVDDGEGLLDPEVHRRRRRGCCCGGEQQDDPAEETHRKPWKPGGGSLPAPAPSAVAASAVQASSCGSVELPGSSTAGLLDLTPHLGRSRGVDPWWTCSRVSNGCSTVPSRMRPRLDTKAESYVLTDRMAWSNSSGQARSARSISLSLLRHRQLLRPARSRIESS